MRWEAAFIDPYIKLGVSYICSAGKHQFNQLAGFEQIPGTWVERTVFRAGISVLPAVKIEHH